MKIFLIFISIGLLWAIVGAFLLSIILFGFVSIQFALFGGALIPLGGFFLWLFGNRGGIVINLDKKD